MTDTAAVIQQRAAFFDHAADHTDIVSVETRDGLTFLVSTHDPSVARVLFLKKSRGEMGAVKRACEHLARRGCTVAGTTFVDVGANIGTTTVVALSAGFGDAVAFEPAAENLRLLRANLAINQLTHRCRIVDKAVSDHQGEVSFLLSRKHGSHRVLRGTRRGTPHPSTTLDTDPISNVGMVWIDVQGHEGNVLAGATQLLAGTPPLVVEVIPSRLRAQNMLESFAASVAHYPEFANMKSIDEPLPTSRLLDALAVLERNTADLIFFP